MAGQISKSSSSNSADPASEDSFASISQINVTPFIDVVLVLLVIFMATAPIILREALQVTLPQSSRSDSIQPAQLALSITESGLILLYGKPIDESSLTTKLKEEVFKNPELQAVISADENARHKSVVHVIDLLKSSGLNNFALEVERINP